MPTSARPAVSTRGKNIPRSAIRKLIPLATEAEQRGVRIIRLNIGQPDIETPREFWEGVRNFKEKVLAYSPSEGRPELLKSFVEYYRRFGITLTESDLVVVSGGIEGVLYSLLAVADPGDDVLVTEPFYANYLGVAAMAQVRFVPVTTTAENGYHLPDRKAVEKCLTPRTRAILFSTPGNPTGCVYTRAEMEMLAEIARERGLFLLSDEVYREFAYDGETPTSVLNLPGMDEVGVIIDSVSKRYSACGARVGLVGSKNRDFLSAMLALATVRLSAPTLDMAGIANCIHTPPAYFERVKNEYLLRRDIVADTLSKVDGVVCPRPKGAFYAMVKIQGVNTEEFCRWLLTSFSLNGETVLVAPGAGFYVTPGYGTDEIRIAYVFEKSVMQRAMDILARGIAEFRKR